MGMVGVQSPGCGARPSVLRGSRDGGSWRVGLVENGHPQGSVVSGQRAVIAGRSAVTQPSPPILRGLYTWAPVTSPGATMTMSVSLKVSLTAWTMVVNAGRVGGLAREHPHYDRPPDRLGQQTVLDVGQALLCRRGGTRGPPVGSVGR
jgi:hypothetical protein